MTKFSIPFPFVKPSLAFASLFAFAVAPSALYGETIKTEEWQIEADKVTNFDNPKSVIAEGNVVLTKIRRLPPKAIAQKKQGSSWSILLEETATDSIEEVSIQQAVAETKERKIVEVTISADWIAYDVDRSSIKARGNVSIKNDNDQLLAESATVNLTQETGSFKQATIIRDSSDLHLEGETIEKTGFNTYHIEDGWVITCKVAKGETPPWSFASTDTTITQGGYATLKHATFRIKGVPVLYTPWLMLPVGNKRKTGFLFPEISNSDRSGFGFNLPLFLNISDSSDLTLYPEYLAKRGFMPGFEYRYILGAQNKGSIMANYLDDDLSDPSETEYWQETGYTHTNQERYWVRGKMDHDFANNIITRADIDFVSDRDYLTEFDTGTTGFSSSNDKFFDLYGRGFQNKTSDERQNSLKILKSWSGMSLTGTFLAINDTSDAETVTTTTIDPDDPTQTPVTVTTIRETPLWKLPSLDFTGSKTLGDTSLALDWDTNYVYYYREEGVAGHRVDLYPRLSMPLPLGPYIEARTAAGLRETLYNVTTNGETTWDKGDTPNRFLGDFHTEIGTTLLRKFSLTGDQSNAISHSFRPYVEYDYLSDTDQDDLPEFDAVDRIADRNEITYGIDNFATLFGKSGSESDYGWLKIKQSYDFRNEASEEPLSPVNLRLRWTPISSLRVIYKTDIGVYGGGVQSYGLESYYTNSRGDYLNVDYRYTDEDYSGLTTEDAEIHQLNVQTRAKLFDFIYAEYEIQHSFSESRVIEQNISLMYNPACWSVELTSQYTPGDHNIMLVFNLANIGSPLGIKM